MDIIWASASEQARLIRQRELSSRELINAHLAHIDTINPSINAIVQIDAERALMRAEQMDRALHSGEDPGPLAGVPYTVKDNVETAGIITAIGVPQRRSTVPAQDATVVRRMNDAGAILIGKTNCPPWGGGIETDNPLYGRTNNPYDVARTPGGSSGGEAAAIASGMTPLGLGSDSGGSLRLPAHFCGIATIKPTAGLIPLTGALDDVGQFGAIRDPRTQLGPLARTISDVIPMLEILRGPDGSDSSTVPIQELKQNARTDGPIRVALQVSNGEVDPTSETINALRDAADALEHAGYEVVTAELPDEGLSLTRRIWSSYQNQMTTSELYQVLYEWDRYRTRLLGWFEAFDLIIRPVNAIPAPVHGQAAVEDLFTIPFSLTGWPAVVVRAGSSDAGLPIGVQVVARSWRDTDALRAAEVIEQSCGGFRRPNIT
jgi:amidase